MKRVRIVRRSWLTPLSIVVRCSMLRSMRRFISRKAWPAWRTSRAPRGRKSTSRPLPRALGGLRKAQDRPDLVAQEQDGDAEQHEGRAAHPHQEDVRVGGIGLAAPRQNAHHVVLVELDAHLHIARAADRIDPVGTVDLSPQLVGEGLVENGEEGLWARRRQVRVAQDVHVELQALRGDARERAGIRCPADSSRRCRSAPRCRRSPRRTGAASRAGNAAP